MSAQAELNFSGPDVTPRDAKRLGRQLDAVVALMADTRWRTHAEINAVVPGSLTAISARVRDLRKLGYRVNRRRVAGHEGLFEYQMELR